MTRTEWFNELGLPEEINGRACRVYLATPYSCVDSPSWHNIRFETVNVAAMALINLGLIVFSPISHSHPIALTQPVDLNTHDIWLRQDEAFMEWADALVVLAAPGYNNSKGVAFEWGWFSARSKPVVVLSLYTLFELDIQLRKENSLCLTSTVS